MKTFVVTHFYYCRNNYENIFTEWCEPRLLLGGILTRLNESTKKNSGARLNTTNPVNIKPFDRVRQHIDQEKSDYSQQCSCPKHYTRIVKK